MLLFMRIALPIWDQRISPVFDVAGALLIADIEGHVVKGQIKQTLCQTDPHARAKAVKNMGINILICGAISQVLEQLLQANGIEVISRKCGNVPEIINAYLSEQIDDPCFTLPGCKTPDCPRSLLPHRNP